MEADESVSSKVLNVTTNSLTTNQLKHRFNFQKRKRKFSITEYKKQKQLKLNNTTDNFSADIDMRINVMTDFKVRIITTIYIYIYRQIL